MHDRQYTRPLSQVLRSVATELAELAALADHLECTLPTSDGASLDLGLAERFQVADLLTQRLVGLTSLFDTLADTAPADVALDVSHATVGLKLADQARRFRGAPLTPPPASGEVLFFGD
jgi:hypothetical protein